MDEPLVVIDAEHVETVHGVWCPACLLGSGSQTTMTVVLQRQGRTAQTRMLTVRHCGCGWA